MAIVITDACINCMACVQECPNHAIYEPSESWSMAEGTKLTGPEAERIQEPRNDDIVYIITEKCTNCVGFHDTPQCAAACPVDCCVEDEEHPETPEQSLEKQKHLHNL